MRIKISIIGAGSAVFSLNLVKDICLSEGFEGSIISLMDVDENRLEAVYSLARRYSELLGKKLKFERAAERKNAIEGSDFVINTTLCGGHQQQEKVREIGEKHGYYRGVDSQEWNFVSDYPTFTSLGQLELALDIARDVKELAPDAWLLQTSNPLLEICTLIQQELPRINLVGLCDGFLGYLELARLFELDPAEIYYQMAGLNHCVWLTRLEAGGRDVYPLIDEWIEKRAEKFWETYAPRDTEPQLSRAAVDMYKVYGLFPVGCTTRNGTWKYHLTLETKKYWFGPFGGMDSELSWPFYLEKLERELERIFRLAHDPTNLLEEIPPVESMEPHVKLIDSLVNGTRRRLVVNIPNPGIFQVDTVVELSASVDARGIHPDVVHLPPETMSAIKRRLQLTRRSLEFFKKRDLDILLDVLLEDPRTKSEKQAVATLNEIFSLPFLKNYLR